MVISSFSSSSSSSQNDKLRAVKYTNAITFPVVEKANVKYTNERSDQKSIKRHKTPELHPYHSPPDEVATHIDQRKLSIAPRPT